MRVFAVPRGMPSTSLISSLVRPPMAASTRARRCSIGSRASASMSARRSVPASASSAGPGVSAAPNNAASATGSAGSLRRTRTASMARLRVMVNSHVVADARRASKDPAWPHARVNASWATSSAVAPLPVTDMASP
jgi:hypothetical protein